MDDKKLAKELGILLETWGADEYGFADLEQVKEGLDFEYGQVWRDYTRAVSFAVYFPWAVVEELLTAPTHTYLALYDILNAKLNEIALLTTKWLEKRGYRAFPVPASQRVSPNKEAGIFSHRLAAHLAGLGWIGKSCALINEKVGPRLRLGTVLTDAPLTGAVPMVSRCGACELCKNICPAHAIKGVTWQEGQDISARLNVTDCQEHLWQTRHSFGKEICGLCIAVCPYGRDRNMRKIN